MISEVRVRRKWQIISIRVKKLHVFGLEHDKATNGVKKVSIFSVLFLISFNFYAEL